MLQKVFVQMMAVRLRILRTCNSVKLKCRHVGKHSDSLECFCVIHFSEGVIIHCIVNHRVSPVTASLAEKDERVPHTPLSITPLSVSPNLRRTPTEPPNPSQNFA